MDIEVYLRDSVLRRPVANGLAIIIANEDSSDPNHQSLRGAKRDLKKMKETFEVLRFATLPILNASKEEILASVQAASKYKEYPPSYKRIAFVFSGHGDENVIYAHDGAVDTNQVYEPLQPKSAPHLADIPKLFFIDACRGTIDDKGIVARGKTLLPRKPSYGNYILAYSTMPSMQAYETEEDGGLWMNIVSKELRTSHKSVLDALTDVNGELLKEFHCRHYTSCQQPVLESTVHETVKLLEEAEELGKHDDVRTSFPPHSEVQPIIEGRQVPGCPLSDRVLPPHNAHKFNRHTAVVPQSERKPMKPVMAPVFMGSTLLEGQHTTQQYSNYQQTQQIPVVTATGSRLLTQVVALQPNSGLQSVSTVSSAPLDGRLNQHVGGMTSSGATTTGGAYYASAPQFSVLQTSLSHGQPADRKPLGHYREALNHYKQTGVILNYDFEDAELYDNMQMCYSSQVVVVLPNCPYPIVGSSHAAIPQKQLAREEAANSAVQQLESLLPKPIPLLPQRDVSSGSAALNHSKGCMSEDARTQLNSFCQTHGVKPQFSFIEDASSGQTRYKCTINYNINGRPERINSTGYFASKAAAKEEAARRLISEETSRMVSSRGATPTAKIWKSELKEYYDKTGQPGAPLKYETKECPKNGFQCTLFAPDIGYVRGDICRNKSEAEHNAAYQALQKLKSD